jgi:hypothetical protein
MSTRDAINMNAIYFNVKGIHTGCILCFSLDFLKTCLDIGYCFGKFSIFWIVFLIFLEMNLFYGSF